MSKCPNCGGALMEGAQFCIKCGQPLLQPAQAEQDAAAQTAAACPNCGAALTPGAQFCVKCGAAIAAIAATETTADPAVAAAASTSAAPSVASPAVASTAPPAAPPAVASTAPPAIYPAAGPAAPSASPPAAVAAADPAAPPADPPIADPAATPADPPASADTPKDSDAAKKQPFYKRLPVLIAAAAVVLIAAAAVALFATGTLSPGGSASAVGTMISADYFAYIKDGELQIANIKTLASFEATSDLYSGTAANAKYSQVAPSLVQITKAGTRVFYPDRFSDDGSFNLYTRTISGGGKKTGNAERLDTDVRNGFRVSADGKAIFYIKGEAKTLYSHNIKEKTKIAGDVMNFVIDKSGTKLYYTDTSSNLYFRNKKANPEKVDSDAALIGTSPDLTTVYYIKDGTLYRRKQGNTKEKIAAGVNDVLQLYDSGEMYYIKEIDSDGFSAEALFYYDGASETKLGGGLEYHSNSAVCETKPVIIYSVYTKDYETQIRAAVKGIDAGIDMSKVFMSPSVNAAGTKLYYVDDYNESRKTGDLWCSDISDNGVKQASQVYEDVYSYTLTSKGGIIYYSELNKSGDAAEFYLNGKQIDSDVSLYSDTENLGSGNILYYTDYNNAKGRGVLKIHTGGKPAMIADDVSAFTLFGGKTIAYLVIEGSSSSGDLFRYDGSKDSKKIDSDVIAVKPIFLTDFGDGSILYNRDYYINIFANNSSW